ncbi:fungal-specific transcription factor domain-containing protein [Truncatella angustata]|uniref:Fungal-specific transcription factor domain-containing protein n=1 Tax=Truncatella angustata TaxID=152316 RepID=A0A9P8UT47_9PEZI|nr:fungal-specific transcription factor domain-containing protein [Truncatella angustata]KAH6657714.1 fungal-specific transcription factor domain-containing protein [Truncatella angustata]
MPKHMALFPHDAGVGGGGAAAYARKANQACYSCRKQKRRCDKALPACSLCSRMARHCDYSEVQPAPTAEDFATLQEKLRQLEDRLSYAGASDVSIGHLSPQSGPVSHTGHTPQLLSREPLWQNGLGSFPAAAFLDSYMFLWSGLQIPKPTVEIPADVLQCIGNAEDLEQTLSDYFGDIHPWFPIVSRKRMTMGHQLWEAGGDIALLLLSMKLITSQPQRGFAASENYLYTASKRYAALLENVGTTSLAYLQALILLALYEYGQGVYPAAYMTVGQAIRYAELLGLPSYKNTSNVLGHPLTCADAEERRRVWWAVYIIDKLVSLGSYRRSMCAEPSADQLLPINDKAWDQGDDTGVFQRSVSSPFSDIQSTFARLCQAALLAGRTLKHHADLEQRKINGERYDFTGVAHLMEDSHKLCKAMQSDFASNPTTYFSLVAARCLNFAAVLKILAMYVANESLRGVGSEWNEEEMTLQITAIEGTKKTATYVRDFAADLYTFISLDEDVVKTPPMVLETFYLGSMTHYTTWKETGDPLAETSYETTRKCLIRLSGRWRLGKEFLDLLEAHEMNYIVGANFQSSKLGGIPLVFPSMS